MLWRVTISDFTGQQAPVKTPGKPSRTSGGTLAAEALKAAGVETIFTLAGGHIMKLLDACVPLGIRVIDHRHEGAAAFAAEGWALARSEERRVGKECRSRRSAQH